MSYTMTHHDEISPTEWNLTIMMGFDQQRKIGLHEGILPQFYSNAMRLNSGSAIKYYFFTHGI